MKKIINVNQFITVFITAFTLLINLSIQVMATSYIIEIAGDQVLVNTLSDPTYMLYPRLDLLDNMSCWSQETYIADLVYAGTDAWWPASMDEINDFFGTEETSDNPLLSVITEDSLTSYEVRELQYSIYGIH